MNISLPTILGAGAFLLCCFLSGFWLSHSGKPLNGLIFNIHKFIALGAVAFIGINVYQANQATALTTIELIACAVSGVFFLGTFISGGLLSTGKPVPALLVRVHQVMPFLTTLSTAGSLYLLGRA
jgi:hypothetical protein